MWLSWQSAGLFSIREALDSVASATETREWQESEVQVHAWHILNLRPVRAT